MRMRRGVEEVEVSFGDRGKRVKKRIVGLIARCEGNGRGVDH